MSMIMKHQSTPKAYDTKANKRIFEFLQAHPIGVLATTDPNGNPHASVIYFSVEDDFITMFTTKRDTKKHDSLKRNNRVQLVVYEASPQTTVQVSGFAEEIEDEADANKAFDGTLKAATATSETGTPPVSKLYAGHYVAYRIKPTQIRMIVFAHPDHDGFDMFETIDF